MHLCPLYLVDCFPFFFSPTITKGDYRRMFFFLKTANGDVWYRGLSWMGTTGEWQPISPDNRNSILLFSYESLLFVVFHYCWMLNFFKKRGSSRGSNKKMEMHTFQEAKGTQWIGRQFRQAAKKVKRTTTKSSPFFFTLHLSLFWEKKNRQQQKKWKK